MWRRTFTLPQQGQLVHKENRVKHGGTEEEDKLVFLCGSEKENDLVDDKDASCH